VEEEHKELRLAPEVQVVEVTEQMVEQELMLQPLILVQVKMQELLVEAAVEAQALVLVMGILE